MQRRTNQYDPIGEFEALVLMAILRLQEDAYGMRIHTELEDTAHRKCSYGAIYTTLDRMEEKGYVTSRVGERTAERGGRAKKYFKLTAAGAASLRQAYRATVSMAQGLEQLLGGAR